VDEAIAERDAALDAAAERRAGLEAQLEISGAQIEAQAAQIAVGQARVEELERVADRLSERIVVRERELRRVRAELADLREDGISRMKALEAVAGELDAVRRQARGQATRIRLRALRDAVEISERVAEMSRRPAEVRERVLDSLRDAIERIGADDDETPASADENGRVPERAGELFEGEVEVEIGPLNDFSQLVGFEDAAGGIGATAEISVKRFTQGRATLGVRLAEPVALLTELEERAPFEFRVRDTRSDRVVLDVEDD
jgi:chromosome segregation ATPase